MTAGPVLRVCLVDMNNGVTNQATRCFRRIHDAFQSRVRAKNPKLEVLFKHVQPRNLGELPDHDTDLILSSGGPGAPHDGFDDDWCTGYRKFLDSIVERNLQDAARAPKLFVVCHSFEIATLHFAVATMERRRALKFGVMPAYMTEEGQRADFLVPFADRLFTWEHRNWEAIHHDEPKLHAMGGAVLARESREGKEDKGNALMALRFALGIEGTQFHPEADKPGVMAWIGKPEHASATQKAYGHVVYDRMMKTLANPTRLARTFALCIPGWLTHRFNEIARVRDLVPLELPSEDMQDFDVAV